MQFKGIEFIEVPLFNRYGLIIAWADVDLSDAHLVEPHRWRRTYYGYAITGSPRKKTDISMHRLIIGLERGDPRQGDHINGDRLDCRRSNLRIVSNAQNAQNRIVNVGTSKYRGVSLDKISGKWVASVKINYKKQHLGRFNTEDEAAHAVQVARSRLMPYSVSGRN